jgi:hypothetical protein
MEFFPEFYGNSSSSPKPSSIIAYKPYPRGPEFHGIVWFVYGNFMEELGPILGHHEASRENLWKIHGFLWIFLWKTHETADP